MDTSLKSKRALVTGASSGIGQAIAEALAREGARVAVHARTDARARPVVERIVACGGEAVAVAADLEDTAAIEPMCMAAIADLGGIDIVVNSAGVCRYARLAQMDQDFWDWHFSVNVRAPFLVTRFTVPTLIAQGAGGNLIFVASTSAKSAERESSAYNASKHAVAGFAKCMADELGGHGIRVNSVAPGWIETRMAAELHQQMAERQGVPYEDVYEGSMRSNMLGVKIPPEAVADMVVMLASERGRCITAQTINVCAGTCYW